MAQIIQHVQMCYMVGGGGDYMFADETAVDSPYGDLVAKKCG